MAIPKNQPKPVTYLKGIDISNWSGPLTDRQAEAITRLCDFVVIGLQDSATAQRQSIALSGLHQEYYMTRPGQAVEWLPEAARVWLDVEDACFTNREDVIKALAKLCDRRLYCGWYANATSWHAYLPSLVDVMPGPLWWASWGVEPFKGFEPFAYFDELMLHQVSNSPAEEFPELEELMVNCDVNYARQSLLP